MIIFIKLMTHIKLRTVRLKQYPNAAAYIFPTTELQGCLFNYAKAIWRKHQECGLQTDNEDVLGN
jgi:hypothetical protein